MHWANEKARVGNLLVNSGPQISEIESTNVKAVLNTPIFSVDEYGKVSHCHCKRFISTACGSRTPVRKYNNIESDTREIRSLFSCTTKQ